LKPKTDQIVYAAREFAAQNPPPPPEVVADMRARLTHARNSYDKALKAISHLEPALNPKRKP